MTTLTMGPAEIVTAPGPAHDTPCGAVQPVGVGVGVGVGTGVGIGVGMGVGVGVGIGTGGCVVVLVVGGTIPQESQTPLARSWAQP
jgi:hypothetical protein